MRELDGVVAPRSLVGRRYAFGESVIALVFFAGAAVLGLFVLEPDIIRPPGRFDAPMPGEFRFGVQLDWLDDSPEAFEAHLGASPSIVGEYLDVPLTPATRHQALENARAAHAVGAAYLLTAMPSTGLPSFTDAAAEEVAALAHDMVSEGIPVVIRFGHEMNAAWYSWGMQPIAYVAAYRRLANAVHREAPSVSLAWGPNYGGDYPFSGWPNDPTAGTPEFEAADTNGDGLLSMADDPYAPYYPGDDVVDIVGFTNYHWGNDWPWGDNELPPDNAFVDQLTGTYVGPLGDQSPLPDFYEVYAQGKGKPLAIFETAALYNPSDPSGASEQQIKGAWISQVLDPSLRQRFPRYVMVLWFEHDKEELATGFVDWRATVADGVANELRTAIEESLRGDPSESRGLHPFLGSLED